LACASVPPCLKRASKDLRNPRGRTLTDTEALVVCVIDVPDHELGRAAIKALADQRRFDYVMDFRSGLYRKGLPLIASGSA